MAKTMKRPIVLDAANSQFSELPDGQFVDAGAIPLDTSSEGNLLKTTDDGLAVRAADAISSAPENVLEVRDGKLYVPDNSATAAGLVSTDSGNKLRVGTDDKLFVEQQVVVSDDDNNLLSSGRDGGARLTPNDVLSNGHPNLLRIDPTDNKIILTQEDITPALEAPSRDPGNLIVAGSDGGCYLSVGKLLGKNNTILHEDGAGKLDADLSLRYSAGTGQLDILGYDGATVVGSVIVPTSTSSLRSAYLVDGKPDAGGEAVEGDYYVSIAMQYDGIYDNGAALKFRGRKSTPAEVSFEYIVDDEHSGVWPVAMKAAFLSDNKTKAVSQGKATVITFDDGSALTITWTGLSGVKLSGTASFTPAVGIEQGAYIRMVYLLASTDVSDVYVDVSKLVDVYLPGDGITIHGDTISVRPKLDGGVTVGPTGVSVDEEWLAGKVEGQLAAGDGIKLAGSTISVKPKPSGGVKVDSTGVSVDDVWFAQQVEDGLKAGNGISLSGATISVKPKPSGGIAASNDGVSITADPSGGVTVGSAGVGVKPKPSGGVNVDSTGVSVDDTWLSQHIENGIKAGNGISLSKTTISVKPKTSGGISVDAGGVSMKVKSASGLTVGTDGLATVVGDGIAFSETGAIIAKLLANGGLAIKRGTGEIYVDFSLLPADMLQEIVRAMVQEGGGLAVDENGQLYVDFSTMPTDKFEDLLKSIRVPIWLEAPLDIYVATTGSDTLDAGRGLSPDKPFATLNAALKYVSSTYNLYIHDVTIHIAEGDYGRDSVVLPPYQTTTGEIVVTGPDQYNIDKVKIGRVRLEYASSYLVKDLTVIPGNSNVYQSATFCTQGVLSLQNVCIDVSATVVTGGGSLYAIANEDAGKTRIYATNSLETKNGVIIKVAGENISACLNCNSGMIQFSADITIQGDATMRNATVISNSNGVLRRSLSAFVNPGRAPNLIATGTVTGVRYVARLNGVIDSYGGGAEFFPGTEPGQVRSGGQYV